MNLKIHNSYRNVVAICDSELMGKRFEEEKRQIDLSGEFFNGEEMSEEQVLAIMKDEKTEDATFNIVGEKAVELALKAGIIKKEGIIKIQGIPIALTLL
ncbi:hypothetical protein A3K73_01945 [Candidatus Pacearchaeota archaeon RBG_13_36_9]|nr:MAG: hypothetical protein A3K73_01945 [Candidatus Pacearchaeota archaeon RBG_13_36_9]